MVYEHGGDNAVIRPNLFHGRLPMESTEFGWYQNGKRISEWHLIWPHELFRISTIRTSVIRYTGLNNYNEIKHSICLSMDICEVWTVSFKQSSLAVILLQLIISQLLKYGIIIMAQSPETSQNHPYCEHSKVLGYIFILTRHRKPRYSDESFLRVDIRQTVLAPFTSFTQKGSHLLKFWFRKASFGIHLNANYVYLV